MTITISEHQAKLPLVELALELLKDYSIDYTPYAVYCCSECQDNVDIHLSSTVTFYQTRPPCETFSYRNFWFVGSNVAAYVQFELKLPSRTDRYQLSTCIAFSGIVPRDTNFDRLINLGRVNLFIEQNGFEVVSTEGLTLRSLML